MARPVWSGSLTFGLVSLPVALYAATEDRTIRFHQVRRGTNDRVRYKRVNERTGREVDWSDVVKGYPLGDGRYVMLEPDELERIAPGRSRTIEIAGFVPLREIDPIFFRKTYYLFPRKRQETRAYALLREALREGDKAGIATLVMRDKQHLASIRAEPDALVLETMFFADEIRDPAEQSGDLPGGNALRKGELEQARQLIDAMAMPWRPEDYRDTYREKVEELVEAKRRGEDLPDEQPPPEPTNVVDLTDALQKSVRHARRGRGRARADDDRDRPGNGEDSGDGEELSQMSKSQLYERAGELELSGRSRMTRAQLEKAVRAAGRRSGKKAS